MSEIEHIAPLLPDYALGLLTAEEKSLAEAHLAQCPTCRAELRALQASADELALGLKQVSPSPAVKGRLMAEIQRRKTRHAPAQQATAWQKFAELFQSRTAWLGVLAVLLIAVLTAGNVYFWTQSNRAVSQQPTLLRVVAMTGTSSAPQATGAMILSVQGEYGTLVVDHLQALSANQQYQLWLIKDGQRSSGAVFSVSDEGYASVQVKSALPLNQYQSFGVTIEPFGGSPGPTGAKVLSGHL